MQRNDNNEVINKKKHSNLNDEDVREASENVTHSTKYRHSSERVFIKNRLR